MPLSHFLPFFNLAHSPSHSGHPRKIKSIENGKQYFFSPGRHKWIVYLIKSCIEYQPNKSKGHALHDAPLEQWGEFETTRFKTIHMDHKGMLKPSSNSYDHCLVVFAAFSNLLVSTQSKNTSAQHYHCIRKWITSSGIPQK